MQVVGNAYVTMDGEVDHPHVVSVAGLRCDTAGATLHTAYCRDREAARAGGSSARGCGGRGGGVRQAPLIRAKTCGRLSCVYFLTPSRCCCMNASFGSEPTRAVSIGRQRPSFCVI